MAGPLTTCENLSVYTNSVIEHADREIGIAKSDFGLDMAGLCMLVCIVDRLARNAISLVTNDGSQLAGPALHDRTVLRLRWGINPRPEFGAEYAQRSREITVLKRRGAQVLDGVASLTDRLVSDLHSRVQDLLGIARTFAEQLPNCLQSEHQTLEALQQGVVQLSCDPGALVDTVFQAQLEPPANLADAQADEPTRRPHQ